MDIQSIKKIIFPAVHDVVNSLEENNHHVKITMLREIFNEALNASLNISHQSNTNIKAMFSGRGRAWAKTKVDENNHVWLKIKNVLMHEISTANENSKVFSECTNMIDLFENFGFAWFRYGSSSKGFTVFHIRTKGSKLDYHLKLRIDNNDIKSGLIDNLEGVPHNLGLESGNFENVNLAKEILNIPVETEELNSLGIMKIEDLIDD